MVDGEHPSIDLMQTSSFIGHHSLAYRRCVCKPAPSARLAARQGMLRVLLVLLHDFPEFLCEFHFELCNMVPPSCIQMRNLILSAFPRNMTLPDPFTPNLKARAPLPGQRAAWSWCTLVHACAGYAGLVHFQCA